MWQQNHNKLFVEETESGQQAVTHNTYQLVGQRTLPNNKTKTAFAWPTTKQMSTSNLQHYVYELSTSSTKGFM